MWFNFCYFIYFLVQFWMIILITFEHTLCSAYWLVIMEQVPSNTKSSCVNSANTVWSDSCLCDPWSSFCVCHSQHGASWPLAFHFIISGHPTSSTYLLICVSIQKMLCVYYLCYDGYVSIGLYLFVCLSDTKLTQNVVEGFWCNLQEMLILIQGQIITFWCVERGVWSALVEVCTLWVLL